MNTIIVIVGVCIYLTLIAIIIGVSVDLGIYLHNSKSSNLFMNIMPINL